MDFNQLSPRVWLSHYSCGTQNRYGIGWVWPVNTTFCQKLVKNKLWMQKDMYQELPKWNSRLWKVSSIWQSKQPMFRAVHISATLPGSQTNHIVSSPSRASAPQSLSCSFSTTWKLPTCSPSGLLCGFFSSCSWKRIYSQPLLVLGGTWAVWKFTPTVSIQFYSWRSLTKRERARKGTGVLLDRNTHWAKRVKKRNNWSEEFHR